jgi:hypothetical protein
MRLSESLRKNIVESKVGGIVNKVRLHKRRDTLFFEDISLEYIKRCEEAGLGDDLGRAAQNWMSLYFKVLIPSTLKKIPFTFLMNHVIKKVWKGMGLMEDMQVEKTDSNITIKTKAEGTTREIGNNKFMPGFYMGILNVIFKSHVRLSRAFQSKEKCEYRFEILDKPFSIESKDKDEYNNLNSIVPVKGFTLKDALVKNIFVLKENNRIYFRGKPIVPIENTLYHLVGARHIMIDDVPGISYRYFKDMIEKKSEDDKKLVLLKNLLQPMGWGTVNIIRSGKVIKIEIRNPPFGLQAEEDNWDFLLNTVLGYFRLIDRKIKIKKVEKSKKVLTATYC